jgi:hypothetical protein
MYCVVTSGVAMGLAIEGSFSVAGGNQEYDDAPLADNWLWLTLQSRSLELVATTFGSGKTETVTSRTPVFPQTVSVMVTE